MAKAKKPQRRDEVMLRAIAKKLKDLRAKTGLSQFEIAKQTGQNVGRMEAAQSNMTISSLEKICRFYKVTLEEFFDSIETTISSENISKNN